MGTTIREAVEAEVQAKIDAGELLAAAVEEHAKALDAAAVARRAAADARRKALQAGWTETQLRKLGLSEGAPKRAGRARAAGKPQDDSSADVED